MSARPLSGSTRAACARRAGSGCPIRRVRTRWSSTTRRRRTCRRSRSTRRLAPPVEPAAEPEPEWEAPPPEEAWEPEPIVEPPADVPEPEPEPEPEAERTVVLPPEPEPEPEAVEPETPAPPPEAPAPPPQPARAGRARAGRARAGRARTGRARTGQARARRAHRPGAAGRPGHRRASRRGGRHAAPGRGPAHRRRRPHDAADARQLVRAPAADAAPPPLHPARPAAQPGDRPGPPVRPALDQAHLRGPRPARGRVRPLVHLQPVPALQGRRRRDRRREHPARRDLPRGRRPARRSRGRLVGLLLRPARPGHGQARRPQGRPLQARQRHELQRRHRQAHADPGRAADHQRDDPRGPLAQGGRAGRQEGRRHRQLPRGLRQARRLQPTHLRRAALDEDARGLPVPRDLRDGGEAGHREPPRRLQLDAFKRNFDADLDDEGQAQEPDALRRTDHRLDDRARGAGRQGAQADRRRHLQPPQAGHAARHRRDDPLRAGPAGRSRCASSELQQDSPYNTRTRAGCRRRRSATRASRRSRPPQHPASVDYLYYVVKPGTLRRARVLVDRRAVRARRRRATSRRGEGRQVARRRRRGRADRGSASSAGRSRHSRSPAMHNAALAALGLGGWRYQLLPVPPELFARRARAARGRVRRRERDRSPQGGARSALADDATAGARARSAPPTP